MHVHCRQWTRIRKAKAAHRDQQFLQVLDHRGRKIALLFWAAMHLQVENHWQLGSHERALGQRFGHG
jgi:hypothetical protein